MGNSKFKGNINTAYGLIHEKDAASDYLKEKQKTHIGCNLIEKGLIFSNEGWFATSVDRIFSCSCCKDKIIVEIKCPKTTENKQTSDFINSINYLKPDENGQAHLIPSHTYYTQIQSQMAITKIHKADFVVWSSNGIISNTMSFDKDFWNDVYDKAKSFYTTIIVPKLMSNEMQ
ncbi:hypothetical protein SNE40_013107 [Patella caerulea]|uniref:YqaJ viral recombinase domain-containing protein n=1 Tax=Patella caerulea TaxID=87958 RepID=A0AAN8JIZ9_PATCE